MELIKNYYSKYEWTQEPEVDFVSVNKDKKVVMRIRIYTGNFSEIMSAIPAEHGSWTGLAYYYNLDIGWYEEPEWEINDLSLALKQFSQAKEKMTDLQQIETCSDLIEMVGDAIQDGNAIIIEYDV